MSFIYSGEPPELFNPAFEACGCFLEHTAPQNHQGDDDEAVTNLQILLLLRQDHKSEPNVWGVPGGKLHLGQVRHEWDGTHFVQILFTTGLMLAQGETAEEAMARELEEETGLALNALAEPQLRPCGRVYVRYVVVLHRLWLCAAPCRNTHHRTRSSLFIGTTFPGTLKWISFITCTRRASSSGTSHHRFE